MSATTTDRPRLSPTFAEVTERRYSQPVEWLDDTSLTLREVLETLYPECAVERVTVAKRAAYLISGPGGCRLAVFQGWPSDSAYRDVILDMGLGGCFIAATAQECRAHAARLHERYR